MPDAFAFTRLPDAGRRTVTLDFEGAPIEAAAGDSVAAAVLAAGHRLTRITPVSGSARGPFCMMGVCFDCLMEIDGEANRQADGAKKGGDLSEDDLKRLKDAVDELIKDFEKKVGAALEKKTADILEV